MSTVYAGDGRRGSPLAALGRGGSREGFSRLSTLTSSQLFHKAVHGLLIGAYRTFIHSGSGPPRSSPKRL
jgi:hypothetical protein